MKIFFSAVVLATLLSGSYVSTHETQQCRYRDVTYISDNSDDVIVTLCDGSTKTLRGKAAKAFMAGN